MRIFSPDKNNHCFPRLAKPTPLPVTGTGLGCSDFCSIFDTRDRFNSDTGWLSFRKPVAGAVTIRPDYSHGMVRTEVLAAISGIHLGHVFNDGPNGSPRYCINATVLEFVAR
jgi:methionine-R-sulfoxide reductase